MENLEVFFKQFNQISMKPQTGQIWEFTWTPEFINDDYGNRCKEKFLTENPDGQYHWRKPIKVHDNGMVQHGTELWDEELFLQKCKPVMTGKLYPIMQQAEVLKQKMILLALGWFDFNEYNQKSNWVILSSGNCYSADFLKMDDLVEGKEIQFTTRQLR